MVFDVWTKTWFGHQGVAFDRDSLMPLSKKKTFRHQGVTIWCNSSIVVRTSTSHIRLRLRDAIIKKKFFSTVKWLSESKTAISDISLVKNRQPVCSVCTHSKSAHIGYTLGTHNDVLAVWATPTCKCVRGVWLKVLWYYFRHPQVIFPRKSRATPRCATPR